MANISGVDWTVNVSSFLPTSSWDMTTAAYPLDDSYRLDNGNTVGNHTGAQPYEIYEERLALSTAGRTALSGSHTLYDGPNSLLIFRVASSGNGGYPVTGHDNGTGQPWGFDDTKNGKLTYGGIRPTRLACMSGAGGFFGNAFSHFYYMLEADFPAGNGPHTVEIEPDDDNTAMVHYGICVTQVVGVEQVAPSGFSSYFNDDGGDNEITYFSYYDDGSSGGDARAPFSFNSSTMEANSIILATNARARQGSLGYSVTSGTRGLSTAGVWCTGPAINTFFAYTDNTRGEAASFHVDEDLASWNKLVFNDISSNVAQGGIAARWNRAGTIAGEPITVDGTTITDNASGEVNGAAHTPVAGTSRVIVTYVVAEEVSAIPSLSSVTYGGVPMTKVGSIENTDLASSKGDQQLSCWALFDADFPTGAGPFNTETVHLATPDAVRVAVQQYSGVAQALPTGLNVSSGAGDSAAASATMTNHSPGSLVTAAGAANTSEGGSGHVVSFTHDGPWKQTSQELGTVASGLTTAFTIPIHSAPMTWGYTAHNQTVTQVLTVNWTAAGTAATTGPGDLTSYTQGIQVDQQAPVGRPSQARARIRLDNSTGIFTPGLGKAYSSVDWFAQGLFIEATVPGESTSVVFHGIVREFSLADDAHNSYVDVLGVDALSLAARGPVADFPSGFSGTTQDVVEGLMGASFTPVDDGVTLPMLGNDTSSFSLTDVPTYPASLLAEGTGLSLRGSARTILDNHVLPSGPLVLFATRIVQVGTDSTYEGQLIGPGGLKSLAGGGRKTYEITDDLTDTSKLYFSSLKFDFLTSDIVNRCKVTRISPTAATQGVQTPSSIDVYGVRAKDFPQVVCVSDSDALSIASYWASRFSTPKFEVLEVDLGLANANIATSGTASQKADLASLLDIRSSLWTQVDLISDSYTGNTGGPTSTRELTIIGRQIRVTHKNYGIKLKTRAQFYAGFILDDTEHGLLNGSDTI